MKLLSAASPIAVLLLHLGCGADSLERSFRGTDALAVLATSSPGQGQIVRTRRVSFSGRSGAAAGTSVVVTATDGRLEPHTCTAAVRDDQTWSCAQELDDRGYTWAARIAADPASAGIDFVVSTSGIPAPTIDHTPSPTNDPAPILTGTADLSSGKHGGSGQDGDDDDDDGGNGFVSLAVSENGKVLCTVARLRSAQWSCRLPGRLADGSHLLTAKQTRGEQTSPESNPDVFVVDTIAPPAPVLDRPTSPTRKRRPVLSGSAEGRSMVTVTDAATGKPVCQAIASGAGAFSCAPAMDLPAGTHRFSAFAADAAGNASPAAEAVTLVVSDAVPAAPTIEFPANGAELEDRRPVISGRTAPGTSVEVVVDGVAFAAQVNPDGKWTVLPPSALGVGPHRVSAAAMDAQLNASERTASSFTTVEGGRARGGCASGGVPWPLLALLAFAAALPGRRTRRRGLGGVLAAGALSLPASAQSPSIDVSLFRPASGGDGYMAVEGARPPLPGEGRLEVRGWSDFAVHPLVFVRDTGSRDVLVRSRTGGWLALQSHVVGPLSIAAQVPVTFAEQGDLSRLPPSSRGPSSLLGGFGDLRLTGRVSLLREEWAGVDLATQASLEVPTARAQTLTDDGRVRGEGLVALGRRLMDGHRGSLDLVTNAYFRLRPPREFLDVKMGNEAGLRAAVAYLPPVVRAWLPRRVYAEVEGRTFVRAGFSAGSSPAEWRLGATVCPARNLAVDLAGGAALTDGVGAPRARFVLGFGWSPSACGRSFARAYAATALPRPASALGRALRALPAPEPKAAQISQLPPNPPEKQLVIVSADRIDILEQVHFATGKALIEPRSHRLLDQVAAVLLTHPDLLLVQVEGHTDDTGGPLRNIVLAQERADAVKDYLVSRGVPAERLRSAGFGQGRPIATNATVRGRAANRRVAFTILQTRSRVLEAERPPDS